MRSSQFDSDRFVTKHTGLETEKEEIPANQSAAGVVVNEQTMAE